MIEAPTGTFSVDFRDGVGQVMLFQRGGGTTIVRRGEVRMVSLCFHEFEPMNQFFVRDVIHASVFCFYDPLLSFLVGNIVIRLSETLKQSRYEGASLFSREALPFPCQVLYRYGESSR